MNSQDNLRGLLKGIVIFLWIFTLLPIIAPIAAHLGLEVISDPIYWIYQWFCHQRPWRSYHLFDYQLAMDARMMLMFGSMAIGGTFVYIKKLKPLKPSYSAVFMFILILPLGLDGSIQALAELSANHPEIPFYESTNLIRSITGTLLGIGVSFGMFPHLNEFDKYVSIKIYLKEIVLTFILSLIFILALVTAWNYSSSEYSPSHKFIDIKQRYPGYNYEITKSAGHSTIERTLKIDEEQLYLDRSKYYNK